MTEMLAKKSAVTLTVVSEPGFTADGGVTPTRSRSNMSTSFSSGTDGGGASRRPSSATGSAYASLFPFPSLSLSLSLSLSISLPPHISVLVACVSTYNDIESESNNCYDHNTGNFFL